MAANVRGNLLAYTVLLPCQCLHRLDTDSDETPTNQQNFEIIYASAQSSVESHFDITAFSWPRFYAKNVALGSYSVYLLRVGRYW
jgi:hypothetical protein